MAEDAKHGARVAEDFAGEKMQQAGKVLKEDAHSHDDEL